MATGTEGRRDETTGNDRPKETRKIGGKEKQKKSGINGGRRRRYQKRKKGKKQKTGDLTRVAVANNQRNEITRSCVNEPAANEAYANEPSLSDRFSMASISHELHANQRLIRMQMRPFMNHQ